MANIKSAKKRIKTINKKKEVNNTFKSSMRTAIKKCEKAIKAKETKEIDALILDATKKIDKACSKGIIKKNTASRYKSNLVKSAKEMK